MPAPPLVNTNEGGTDTVGITTANSGGASGDAWSAKTETTGAITFSATQARDTLSAKFAMNATGTALHLNWTGMGSLAVPVFFRWYLYMDKTAPLVGTWFDMLRGLDSAAGRAFNIGMTTGDKLRVGNAADTAQAGLASTTSIPNQSWCRIEVKATPGLTTGDIEWRLYLSPDSSTITETKGPLGANMALLATFDQARWGVTSTPTGLNGQVFYMDNFAVSTTDWIGTATIQVEPTTYTYARLR